MSYHENSNGSGNDEDNDEIRKLTGGLTWAKNFA